MQLALPKLHPGQAEVWRNRARFEVVCCGRRWGKTSMGVMRCVECAAQGGKAWWIAPSYGVGGIGWDFLRQLLAPVPDLEVNKSDRRIILPNGGVVQVKSADRPDLLRGEGLDLAVFDEAADINPETWTEVIRPALAERHGAALFIGTPRGMDNWFYDLWARGQVDTKGEWKSWQRPTSDNPIVPADEIAAAREDMGPILFAQEFLAEFVVPGGSVIRPEWIKQYVSYKFDVASALSHEDAAVLMSTGDQIIESPLVRQMQRYLTVDTALSTRTEADYTVIGCFGKTPEDRVVLLDVVRKRMESPDILPAILGQLTKWNAAWAGIERTQHGLAIIQEGKRAGVPIREIPADKDKFAKAALVGAAFEAGVLWIPMYAPWKDAVVDECVRFPRAQHDDVVDVLYFGINARQKVRRGSQLASW